MTSATEIEGLTIRRSYRHDAPQLAHLLTMRKTTAEGLPSPNVFGVSTAEDFMHLIETSFLTLTAISPDHKGGVVGFIAFSTAPRLNGFPAQRWGELFEDGFFSTQNVTQDLLMPFNTLWLNMLMAPSSKAFSSTRRTDEGSPGDRGVNASGGPLYTTMQLCEQLMRIALGSTPRTEHVLCGVPAGESFPLLRDLGRIVPVSSGAQRPSDMTFQGTVLYMQRHQFVPPLEMRLGRMEDYDTFVPLFVHARGVVTEVPRNFYLEEVLKDQNETHKVIIAENPITHHVIGLACLRVLGEAQVSLTRQYATDIFGKFCPMGGDETVDAARAHIGRDPRFSNTFMIDFLYFDPDYDGSASQFVAFMFSQFAMCEYATILLPHDLSEPPMLRHFVYLPVRKFVPLNAEGEVLRVPDGLWACCRYSLDPLTARPVRSANERARVESFLESPCYELSPGCRRQVFEDLRMSMEVEPMGRRDPHRRLPMTTVFQLSWRKEVVGVATACRMNVRDMYALRSNYNLDAYIYFYAHTGKDYGQTDLSLTPEEGMRKYRSKEMPGVVIRAMYVKHAFCPSLRFFVGEVLRLFRSEVALVLADQEDAPFCPLVWEMLPVQPRRVVERPPCTASGDEAATVRDSTDDETETDVEVEGGGHEDSSPDGGATRERAARGADLIRMKDVAALSCLFVTTNRCLGDEKKRVNTRIAVVGASATGLSFLYRLLSFPYVRFTNVCLLSTDGLPLHPNRQERCWMADRMELLEREHVSLLVGSPLRVVTGSMVDLDKSQRFISVDNGSYEPYDYVVLATGRQFINPSGIRSMQQQEGRPSRSGVIPISGELSLDRLRRKLLEIDQQSSNIANVMVYGSGLDAFSTATAMMQVGFSPQRIVVCCRDSSNPFIDEVAYQAVVALFKSLGANVLRGYDVVRMEFDDDNNLCTVMLSPVSTDTKAGEMVELGCCLIVALDEKDIDPHVLSTLNKRSIVFDGRVIVESNYRTSDPHVFAAGPVAMFTRRYGTTHNFDDFNARDVGSHLATVLMGFMGFDEFYDPKFHEPMEGGQVLSLNDAASAGPSLYAKVLEENGSKMTSRANATQLSVEQEDHLSESAAREALHRLPQYTTPLARRVHFPGDYAFFSASSVGFAGERCIRLDYSTLDMSNLYNSVPMEDTLSPVSSLGGCGEQNLLVVFVNAQTRTIDGIVYFGNGAPEVHNYYALIGYPETVLNLLYRYKEAQTLATARGEDDLPGVGLTAGVVRGKLDLMEYLRLPHLQSVFLDTFATFFHTLRDKMKIHETSIQLRERILHQHVTDHTISEEEFAGYQAELTQSKNEFKRAVQLELVRFLHEQKDFLPQNILLPNIESSINGRTSVEAA